MELKELLAKWDTEYGKTTPLTLELLRGSGVSENTLRNLWYERRLPSLVNGVTLCCYLANYYSNGKNVGDVFQKLLTELAEVPIPQPIVLAFPTKDNHDSQRDN